ncbi:aat family amino acid transporter [Fusarium albosuccineum]|uniref:Aat family amino acid transporter n=1 Tax=Fusarium albosuccineum TaxID=1237068 RepID=A0A8H4LET1_9HYPO|nr:aat family amino acid transporter [Fusarium albosuccineum]
MEAPIGWSIFLGLVGLISYQILKTAIRPNFSKLRHLPGPKDNQFLVGQALRVLRAAGPNDLYLQWMRRWPDAPFIRCLTWLNSEMLLVNNLDACREVLQTNAYSFVKPAFFHTLVGEFLGIGLLFSVGDEHKRLRRIVAGPLSRPSVRRLMPIFVTQSRDLNQELDDEIKKDGDNIIDIEAAYIRASLNIIGISLLGKELHSFRSPSSPLTFEQCYSRILAQPVASQIISFINPFIPLRWLPVNANLDFVRAKAALKTMMTELIDQRQAEVLAAKQGDADGSISDDLLTRMLEASLDEEKRLSKQELIDITMQVIAAGHETTASALTWTTYALVMNPEVQDRLRAELVDIEVTNSAAKAIDDLPYLNNVIRETLRVYSPTLIAPWEAGEDMVIAGVNIPKGTTIQTVPAMVQLNPKIWGDDAEVFNPDRWDSLSGEASSPFALEVFLNGPRMCPGKALAMLEIKVLLAGIIKNFRLESVDGELSVRNPSLTLKPKDGLRVRVSRV